MGLRAENIHPRSYYPNGQKKNICKPRSKTRLVRAASGIIDHLANHPNDADARQRLANLERRISGR